MRYKFTIILLLLNLIVFGSIAYLKQQAQHSSAASSGLSGQIGREIIEADRIELRSKNLPAARILKRVGATWSITEPMQWPANYFAVNRMLNQLQFLEEDASFSVSEIKKTGQSLADYGLEDPLVELKIAEGENVIVLRIGTLTEIGNNVYILGPDGANIFVVDRQVIDSLLVDLGDLRTREIFDVPVFEVEALSLQLESGIEAGSGSLKVRLVRNNQSWSFEAPLKAEADPTLVSNTINTLTAAKAIRFIEATTVDPLLTGLDKPSMRVTLHGNKRRQTILVGNKENNTEGAENYFAQLENNPTIFTVKAQAFDQLREAQEALRERNFMEFDPASLSSINISENEREIRLQKLETGNWQVIETITETDIRPRRADPQVMAELIQSLKALRASAFTVDTPTPSDLERLGFNQPRRIVELTDNMQGKNILYLSHPETDNQKLYARTIQADFVYEIERRPTLGMLPLNALYYRNRTLETLPEAANITSIKLENLETGAVLFQHRNDSAEASWLNVLVELPTAERYAILNLLQSIRQAEVKLYLKDGYSAGYTLDSEKILPWAYRLSAEISLPGGDTPRGDTRSYVFTKRLSGSMQVGGSELHEAIFEVQQATIDALYAFTETMQLPPELTESPVPLPIEISPVPEPAPTRAPTAP
ncbi:MAG: hypothetical protein ACI81V_001326 [Lentimonas sp.]|jgi:hypothetical protein